VSIFYYDKNKSKQQNLEKKKIKNYDNVLYYYYYLCSKDMEIQVIDKEIDNR